VSRNSTNLDVIPGPRAARNRGAPGHGWQLVADESACAKADSGSPLRGVRNDDETRSILAPTKDVLRIADIGFDACAALLARHGLQLVRVKDGAAIPGSFWGECEAGIIGSNVHARADTPVHSLLHEACHLLVLDPERRAAVHTDASDSLEEEDATCYLQIVLADALPGFGRDRALTDMDAWGYTFRLGSARAWFEHDAEDARAFLVERGLL
jgi:hypothetical protein